MIDTDNNGYVDKEELIEYMLSITGNKMVGDDRMVPTSGSEGMNLDQMLDLRARFDEVVSGLFERMDRSNDQKVDITEFID